MKLNSNYTFSVLDTETNINNRDIEGDDTSWKIGDFSGSPHHPNNNIVMLGRTQFKQVGGKVERQPVIVNGDHTFTSYVDNCSLLVGHNIKFDLIYMLKDERYKQDLMNFFRSGNLIWDTQHAEYLFTAQVQKQIPLSSKRNNAGEVTRYGLSHRYGGGDKTDKIKEYWDAGIDTAHIPHNELQDYCVDDVRNTHTIFNWQYKRYTKLEEKAQHWFISQMRALVFTTFAEYFGMRFDDEGAVETCKQLAARLDALHNTIAKKMAAEFSAHGPTSGCVQADEVNPGSTKQLSVYFYGGALDFVQKKLRYNDDGTIIKYKTGAKAGQRKYFNETLTIDIPQEHSVLGALVDCPSDLGINKTAGGYSTDNSAIESILEIAKNTDSPHIALICNEILQLRNLSKDVNTYYLGMLKAQWPHDKCIHGKFNHCVADTGRLTSSGPNLQNITDKSVSGIKKNFISRFELGQIVEIDYSQLEIIGVAILSGDPNLLQDLKEGKDLHCVIAAELHNADYHYVKNGVTNFDPYWVERRRVAKAQSFRLQYGAGAASMAEDLGLPKADCEQFIDAYYSRYPRLKEWQDENIKYVNQNSRPYRDATGAQIYKLGEPCLESFLPSVTGRYYRFVQQETPEFMQKKGIHLSFSPTQIKNYPSQGFATGDIVPIALGEVIYWIIKEELLDFIVPIGTIHDSLLFDMDRSRLNKTKGLPSFYDSVMNLRQIMESIPSILENDYRINFHGIPLKTEAKAGPNWLETHVI